MYSNEAERANQDIYDDFDLKRPFGLVVYTKLFHRFNPLTAKLFNLNFHPLEVVPR